MSFLPISHRDNNTKHMDEEMSDSREENPTSSQLSSGSDGNTDRESGQIHVSRGRGRGRRGRPRKRRGAGSRGATASVKERGKKRRADGKTGEKRRQEVDTVIASRQDILQDKINKMDHEEMRRVLSEMAHEEPSIIFKLLEKEGVSVDQAPSPEDPLENLNLPSWCVCRRCRIMPTPQEEICCGYRPDDCASQLPNFRLVCLDPEVLRVAQTYRRDFLANVADRDPNREKRHTGYRQYVLWKHGKLGEGNRIIIPSCCVWAIRDTYPDTHGFYVGFKEGRLE